jgi:hypothetical protein
MNQQAGMSQGTGGGMGLGGRMWHWSCCILPIVSCLMWVAGIVFLILSWVSVLNATGEIWGLGPQWYIWNAVMFGILAIYGGKLKIGSCRGGACVHGCKDGVCVYK